MKDFSNKITLSQNSRGVWGIDPLLGCSHGHLNNGTGCYGVCYASQILKFRGFNFDKPIKRYFINESHFSEIADKLMKIPFVRMGVCCDPSDDWEHTISIIKQIRPFQGRIVIVTKHWEELSDKQIESIRGLVVNTSISALDSDLDIRHRLKQYNRLKASCYSVLRVNTAKFFDDKMNERQRLLLHNDNVIDNVLRFKKKKVDGIDIKRHTFLNDKKVLASKHDDAVYFGDCYGCPDLCGVNMFDKTKTKLERKPEQITLLDFI